MGMGHVDRLRRLRCILFHTLLGTYFMSTKPDIRTPEHIRQLVDTFYDQVRVDPLLGGIFNGVIGDRWPEHLARCTAFGARCWSTKVRIRELHLDHMPPCLWSRSISIVGWSCSMVPWIRLFAGPVANLAHLNAVRMAEMFISRINLIRDQPEKFIQ